MQGALEDEYSRRRLLFIKCIHQSIKIEEHFRHRWIDWSYDWKAFHWFYDAFQFYCTFRSDSDLMKEKMRHTESMKISF